MRIVFIANPSSGTNGKESIDTVIQALTLRGHSVETRLTSKAMDACRFASEITPADCDRIIVAGGDGTFNEVLSGLSPDFPIPLAVIPIGTANVLAKEIGLPTDLRECCRIAVEGDPTSVSTGSAGERRFVMMAGIGIDAQVVRQVDLAWKKQVGKLAYLTSGIKAFWSWQDHPIRLINEQGKVYSGFGAIISNGRYYAGKFIFSNGADLRTPHMNVCLFKKRGRWPMLMITMQVLLGKSPAPSLTEQFTCKSLQVDGTDVPIQIDGDAIGSPPTTLAVQTDALQLITPGKYNTT